MLTIQEHTYLQIERFLLEFSLAATRNRQRHLTVFLLEFEASRSSGIDIFEEIVVLLDLYKVTTIVFIAVPYLHPNPPSTSSLNTIDANAG